MKMRKLASLFLTISLLIGGVITKAETPTSSTTDTFKVHAKVPADWTQANLYAWTDNNKYLGDFPGQAMNKNGNYYELAVNKAAQNIVVSNGQTDANKKQTVDIKVAGETWVVLGEIRDNKYTVKTYTVNPETKITVKVKVPATWQNPSIWAWRGKEQAIENVFATFPGQALTKEATSDYYTCDLPSWVTGIIISYKNGTEDVKTEDITVEPNKNVWLDVKDTNNVTVSYTEPQTQTKHTVTFDADNGTEPTKVEVEHGKMVTAPTAPTKEGHTFTGWYQTTSTGLASTNFQFKTTAITEDITLKASWETDIKKVTFDYADDGATAQKIEQVEYGKTITAPTAPTRTGFTFKGWFEKENGNYKASEFNFSTEIKQDITLYAKWEQVTTPQPPQANITVTAKTRKLSGDFVVDIKDEQGQAYPTGSPVVINYANDKSMVSTVANDGTCLFANKLLPNTEITEQEVTIKVQKSGQGQAKEYKVKLTIPAQQKQASLQADKALEVEQNSDLANLNLKDQANKFADLVSANVKEIKILGTLNSDGVSYTQLKTTELDANGKECSANIKYTDDSNVTVKVKVKVVAKKVKPTPPSPNPNPAPAPNPNVPGKQANDSKNEKADQADIIPYVPSQSDDTFIEQSKKPEVTLLDQSVHYFSLGSQVSADFRFNAEPQNLISVMVDGKTISSDYYDVRHGSTIVSLQASFLNSLKPGKHTLTSNFISYTGIKQGKASFYVLAQNMGKDLGKVAKTGELASSQSALFFVVTALGLVLSKIKRH